MDKGENRHWKFTVTADFTAAYYHPIKSHITKKRSFVQ